jgi:hypothetical protein
LGHTGPAWHHLAAGSYFEIRHFSDFLDPNEWFEKKDKHAMRGNL